MVKFFIEPGYNVKAPERDYGNAGIDFFIPEYSESFVDAFENKNAVYNAYISNDKTFIRILPHGRVNIPSGIRSKFGPHLALIANNKSGIATKKKLVFGASVIDNSYQGEWHLHLINTSDTYQSLEFGQKAIQFIPHLIATDEVEVLDLTPEEFYTEKTSRGDGWQGSTGVK